jgi:hypothetical protein
MTTLSRRTMLQGATALPVIAMAASPIAAGAGHTDADLIALGERPGRALAPIH